MIQIYVHIKGDVIGVGFRAWTKIQAKRLGVTGWVRNTPEGQVEAVFQGEKERVKEIVEMVKKGPPVSRVDAVEASSEDPTETFTSFEIRST